MDETELHPAIVAGFLLSVAIICAGILWVWFPESPADDAPSQQIVEEEVETAVE